MRDPRIRFVSLISGGAELRVKVHDLPDLTPEDIRKTADGLGVTVGVPVRKGNTWHIPVDGDDQI